MSLTQRKAYAISEMTEIEEYEAQPGPTETRSPLGRDRHALFTSWGTSGSSRALEWGRRVPFSFFEMP